MALRIVPDVDRPWARVRGRITAVNGCWNWTAAKTKAGYGLVGFRGGLLYVHRIAYEEFVGPIPDGLTIDHLCRNRACCNPVHLEVVTLSENARRGEKHNRNKTHCHKGHAFTPENTYSANRGASRGCRTCRTLYHQAYAARGKAA